MNELVQKLVAEAGLVYNKHTESVQGDRWYSSDCGMNATEIEKLVESVVRECIRQAHSVAELRGINDDNIYGADTAAVKISKHFGIE